MNGKWSKIIMNLPVKERLTCAEKDIIRLLADGCISKEIAPVIKHTHETTETIRTRLLKKIGARNTAHLVSIAYREGILKA